MLGHYNIRFRGALLDIDDWNEKINYAELEPVCLHQSPPLSEIISVINKRSHNLAAEMLLKTIGKESLGVGSFIKGIEQVKKFAVKVGINPENISIVDGSGLSRYNLSSPVYQVALLSSMYRSRNREIFMKSLTVPGSEGTLKRRMTRSRAEKSIRAKTGSMNNVSTISGYVTTRDNEVLAFSIMIMNYTQPESLAHNLQDLICMRLASFTRKY